MQTLTRRATIEDIPVLVEMMQEFYAEAHYEFDKQWATASFFQFLINPALGAAWIVSHSDEAAGYVVMTVGYSMEYGGLDAFIDDLFVRKEFRGKGYGRAALDTLFEECARRSILAVHVVVGRDNTTANALYSSYNLALGNDGRQLLSVKLPAAEHTNE